MIVYFLISVNSREVGYCAWYFKERGKPLFNGDPNIYLAKVCVHHPSRRQGNNLRKDSELLSAKTEKAGIIQDI